MADDFGIEIDDGFVSGVHGMGVLGQESRVEAAEGVQFHAGDEPAGGVLLFDGADGGLQFGGGVGEVEEDGGLPVFGYFLEPFGGTVVSGDAAEEVGVGDAQFPAGEVGGGDVLEVVLSEHAERHLLALHGGEAGDALFDRVGESVVGELFHRGCRAGKDVADVFVAVVVDEAAAGGDFLEVEGKLFHVVVEGGEYVHVVPRDAGENGNVGVVVVEFGTPVDGRGEVFVAFEDGDAALLAEAYHGVEAFQEGARHVVERDAAGLQDVHDHGGGGRFAVAAPDDDAPFVFGLFVEIFGVAVYPDA